MLTNLFLGQTAEEKNFIEDLFSCYLYTGNGSTQTINNGIDLAGNGGMVWVKSRSNATANYLMDTARGRYYLTSNGTSQQSPQFTGSNDLVSYDANGFSIGTNYETVINSNAATYASWTFRKAQKFFDVVTVASVPTAPTLTTVNHSLGVTPGMIIYKRTDGISEWMVWHRSTGNNNLALNTTGAAGSSYAGYVMNVTASSFQVYAADYAGSYVFYVFAHDTTADGVIQCGSYTTDGSGNATVNLGWEPQYVLYKPSSSTGSWWIADNMRGMTSGGGVKLLAAQNANAELSAAPSYMEPTATGFKDNATFGAVSTTVIYLAIRRGPMRVPTDATKVFSPSIYTGAIDTSNANNRLIESTDLWLSTNRAAAAPYALDRLRGWSYFRTSSTAAENTGTTWTQTNQTTLLPNAIWWGSISQVDYYFRRAPGFFDVVCYTGTGSTRTVSHNLGVAPELIMIKSRGNAASWIVQSSQFQNGFSYDTSTGTYGFAANLNSTAMPSSQGYVSGVTATVFGLNGGGAAFNASAGSYVAYLFASCPGVSKVGTFTGNGSSLNIDCGFTNGARFVLIKRTDSTGDWYVWDTARGIVAANDPHLSLNSTAAEVTTNDSIDPLSTGFTVNQNATTNVNVSGATYIYLAIA